MAYIPVSFQPGTFQENNPALAGMQSMAEIIGKNIANQYAPQMNQQDLQAKQLANALSQINLQYAPQMTQAELAIRQAQPGLIGAQTNLMGQQAKWMGPEAQARINLENQQSNLMPYKIADSLDPVSKMIFGRELVNKIVSGQSGIPAFAGGSSGTTSNSPINSGNMSLSPMLQGGSQNYPGLSANSGTNNSQPQGLSDDVLNNLYGLQLRNTLGIMGKDPTMGSSKSGAGGTYTDPFTGKQFTTDTSANTTMDQQTIGAIQRVAPILDRLKNTLSPFQTLSGQMGLRSSQFQNWALGSNTPLANLYAEGQEALQTAPEALIRAWGLKVTNDSLDRLQKAVQPHYGESSQGYNNRIMQTLDDLKRNQGQAGSRLRSGINLDDYKDPDGNIDITKLSDDDLRSIAGGGS